MGASHRLISAARSTRLRYSSETRPAPGVRLPRPSYEFTVAAMNAQGAGTQSAQSNSVQVLHQAGVGCRLFEMWRRFRYRRHILAASSMVVGVRLRMLRPVCARSWL